MSDAGECVRCNARLHTLAAFCSRCGLVVQRKPQLRVPDELRRLADRHRSLMRVFVAFIFVQLTYTVEVGSLTPLLQEIVSVFCLIFIVLTMVSVLSLTDALHRGVTFSVLLTVLCLVPILNLLIVMWLSWRARQELRNAGIRAGFFGARRRNVDFIAYEHRCRLCGYDLRGLTSLKCPECGTGFAAPMVTAIG